MVRMSLLISDAAKKWARRDHSVPPHIVLRDTIQQALYKKRYRCRRDIKSATVLLTAAKSECRTPTLEELCPQNNLVPAISMNSFAQFHDIPPKTFSDRMIHAHCGKF